MAAAQAAPAIGGLLFGENSLFSGKGRQASRELGKAFEESQSHGINQNYYDVLARQKAMANQGLGDAAIALAQQQQGRATNAMLSGLSNRRSLLAGLPGLSISSNDLAMRLAGDTESLKRQGQQQALNTQWNIGGLEEANWQRKMDERNAYWGGRKAESNAAISSNLTNLGKTVSSIAGGKFKGLGGDGGLGGLFKDSAITNAGAGGNTLS